MKEIILLHREFMNEMYEKYLQNPKVIYYYYSMITLSCQQQTRIFV